MGEIRRLVLTGVVVVWVLGLPGWAQEQRETREENGEASGVRVSADEEKLRTAVVNIQELFRQYHKVKKAEEEINMERARIQKEHNDLAGRLRSMDQSLRELEVRLQKPGLSNRDRASLEREKGVRFHEREFLRHERKANLIARHSELNRKMVAHMDALLEEIRDIVAARAERWGYDLVFDLDGTNSSQVPMLLFAKEATDITPRILKGLK